MAATGRVSRRVASPVNHPMNRREQGRAAPEQSSAGESTAVETSCASPPTNDTGPARSIRSRREPGIRTRPGDQRMRVARRLVGDEERRRADRRACAGVHRTRDDAVARGDGHPGAGDLGRCASARRLSRRTADAGVRPGDNRTRARRARVGAGRGREPQDRRRRVAGCRCRWHRQRDGPSPRPLSRPGRRSSMPWRSSPRATSTSSSSCSAGSCPSRRQRHRRVGRARHRAAASRRLRRDAR